MTDPEMADATYIEPIATPILEQIIAKERPDALLPTLGARPRSTPPWRWARPAS